MFKRSGDLNSTSFRPIPLVPIYAFSFLSALTVSFSLRFEHSARAALLVLALTIVFEFLRAFGLRFPPLPRFGVPVSMIVLWTVGLILAASWQRSSEGREE